MHCMVVSVCLFIQCVSDLAVVSEFCRAAAEAHGGAARDGQAGGAHIHHTYTTYIHHLTFDIYILTFDF